MTLPGSTEDVAPVPGAADLALVLQSLLRPLARLIVAKGLPFATVQAEWKAALVEAAAQAHPDLPPHRRVSRISTTLGLNRREVTRLTRQTAPPAVPRPSLATEVFLRWRSDPTWRTTRGTPRVLPRAGADRSFETLARSVTQDVHPRSLLDELCRLGLAQWDEGADRVRLVADAFVPRGDLRRMLAFLAHNVGDHLAGAVANVLGDGRQHFEQAIFADELSAESIEAFKATVMREWDRLLKSMVPELESLIADDRALGRCQDRRLRIGLFTYEDAMAAVEVAPSPSAMAADEPATEPVTEPVTEPATERAGRPRRRTAARIKKKESG